MNPHDFRHQNLNLACLPVSPRPQSGPITQAAPHSACCRLSQACPSSIRAKANKSGTWIGKEHPFPSRNPVGAAGGPTQSWPLRSLFWCLWRAPRIRGSSPATGSYVDDLELDGALTARSCAPSARTPRIDRDRHLRRSRARRRRRCSPRRPTSTLGPPRPFPMIDERMGGRSSPPDKVRFVGEIIAAWSPTPAPPASTLPNASGPRWSRCPWSPTSARRSPTRRCCSRTRARTSRWPTVPSEPSADLFDGCDIVVEGELNSQRIHVAPIEPRATAAVWEDGRLNDMAVDPDATPGPRRARRGARGRARQRARDRTRRRRRLRRQGARPEDVLVAWLAREARPAGALDRDTL